MKEQLLQQAIKQTAQFPQYRGFFDKWVVCRAVKNVRFKGAATIVRDGLYLCSNHVNTGIHWKKPNATYRTVYVPGYGCCSTPTGALCLVQE